MSTILVEATRPGVVQVTLNRPESLNAMSYPLVSDLHDAFTAIERDYEARVVILTGAGRGFCAGFDLAEPGPEPGPEGIGQVQRTRIAMREFYGLITHMRRMRQPIIAASSCTWSSTWAFDGSKKL